MVEIRNLTKCYGERKAIDNLSFRVNKGEVVGFLGPNGAGKSTTMKIITGFMAPTSGEVIVGGYDVFENPIEVKRKIGYLPETPPLYGEMVVEDYLDFVARLKGVEGSKVAGAVSDAIERTHLGDVRKRLIQNLSKGYRQRVGVAQALVSRPEILILDEPTVGLDPRQVAEIRHLLQELRGQHTIILSTHILSEVQATCERVIIINQGKIVAEDTLAGLGQKMNRGGTIHIRLRRNADRVAEEIRRVDGVKDVEISGLELKIHGPLTDDFIELVAEKITASRSGLLSLNPSGTGLEEVFIQLTSKTQANGREL